ncbi:IclR family transcriptional regulator [Sulfitobacter sp. F26169L]|uniref:IclR family transcriptional regulator n=1 Tax=Sulfitobacter sp. F26169L TaxID=2996015 RepID=UPI002260CD50|nr:IclR family transcriptional regulator [Sulfitobacter sp. F26169L]MCX7565979.1 IclR family transcriptional regulator [Sulfitobacter sp. F26169L]
MTAITTDQSSPTDSRRSSVQAVDVAASVLDAMCDLRRPAQLKDIARIAGLQSAKAHRYLTSLVASGLAAQNKETGLYSLGPMALRLGVTAISNNDLIHRASESLRDLCAKHQTSGHLAIWGERGPVLIRNEHGGPPIILTVGLGATMPLLRSASGHIFLSYLPRRATEEITHQEMQMLGMDEAGVSELCAETRARGYGKTSGGLIPGLYAAAFPVFGIDGNIQCSISFISTDANFFSSERDNLDSLLNAAQKLSDAPF